MRSAVKFQEGICKKQRRSLQELGEIYAISCFDSQKHMTGGRRMETLFFPLNISSKDGVIKAYSIRTIHLPQGFIQYAIAYDIPCCSL